MKWAFANFLRLNSTYLVIDLKLRVKIDSFYKLINTNNFFCTRNVNYFINSFVYYKIRSYFSLFSNVRLSIPGRTYSILWIKFHFVMSVESSLQVYKLLRIPSMSGHVFGFWLYYLPDKGFLLLLLFFMRV